jgi:hypothetical protein
MNYERISTLLFEIAALKGKKSTLDAIVAHARKMFPALPEFVECNFCLNEKILGVDKDGRRWIMYGQWVFDGTYDLTTIIRETRRQHAFNWLIGGQADKNCKNVWGSNDEGETRIVFHELEQKQKEYHHILSGR